MRRFAEFSKYVPYKNRPEWSDVKPIPQDDGNRSVVKIAYSEDFVDAHDYFRAMLAKDERSVRAFDLTTNIVTLNPANYTCWEYRRRIIETLDLDLWSELQYVRDLIKKKSKYYESWKHRQWVVDKLASNTIETDELNNLKLNELNSMYSVIEDDSKNFHAWQHRYWVVTRLKVSHESELKYAKQLIEDDVLNNSAWNHCFTIVTQIEGLNDVVMNREVEFAKKMIRLAPNNQSSWNYLYGLIVPLVNKQANSKYASPNKVSQHSGNSMAINIHSMRRFAEDLIVSDPKANDSGTVLGFLVDLYIDCIKEKLSDGVSNSKELSGSDLKSVKDMQQKALTLCERLTLELDRIRAKYWQYRAKQINSLV